MMMKQITNDVLQKAYAVRAAQEAGIQDLSDFEPAQEMEYNLTADGDLVPKHTPLPETAPVSPIPSNAPGVLPQSPVPVAAGAQRGMFPPGGGAPPASRFKPVQSGVQKVGRNDPCPCGSGKKYKKCHGR